ncbi:MAG: CDP-diacylglycerol--glycerol-3-phosphate 3-phosphatidyltransferase [Thermoleophilia bacterium]|nr:CDP-diacylglycerol--glycerol-3-phosphate 3-phosphatidyltransferase [Thermoleophilia bacterium]
MRAQLNLPNTLTLVRILLVPIVLIGLLRQSDSGDVVAAAAFAIASTTDWFDGYLARSRGLVTTFGKVMDPIADKLLITTTLVTLSALDRLSWWATGIVLVREFAVSALRLAVAEDGHVISASQYGKLKTVLQSFVVLVVILATPAEWVDALVWAMVGVTVATGLDYFVNVRKRLDPPAA